MYLVNGGAYLRHWNFEIHEIQQISFSENYPFRLLKCSKNNLEFKIIVRIVRK